MQAFVDSLNIIKGHLTIYRLYRDGISEKVFDEDNIIVSGMGVGLSYLFSVSGGGTIQDYQLSKFQVGVSGWSGNQVSSTFELSGALTSVEEYGVDSNILLEIGDQIKNGKVTSNNVFGLIPDGKVTKIRDKVVRYTIVLDEEACNNLDSDRGKVGLSEIGLFMKNPMRKIGSDASILVAYRTFTDIKKTNDFSLVFRWVLFGPVEEEVDLPEQVGGPDPEDGATSVAVSASFLWDEASGAISYSIYLGDTTSLTFQGNQSRGPGFTPSGLEYSTTYYWRVDSVNLNGTTVGPVWTFTTEADPNAPPTQPPAAPSNPSPASGVSSISVSATLSWDAASGASGYAVYFGSFSDPGSGEYQGDQSGLTFDPSSLSWATEYFWRIYALNSAGATPSPIWNFFTVSGGIPSNPSPADDAISIEVSSSLSWNAASGASSYDVFIGVTSALGAGHYQGNQAGLTFTPSALGYSTDYYWKVNASGIYGIASGTLWSFTTVTQPPPPAAPTNPSPADASSGVSSEGITLSWDAGASATSYAVYFGTDSTPDSTEFKGNQAGLTYNPGTLAWLTTYYWQIGSINAFGTTSGSIWSFTTIAEPPPPIDPPEKATNPNPAVSATAVPVSASMSWGVGFGADSYTAYIGTTSSLGAGHYQGEFSRGILTFTPSSLAYNTVYYWRIDSINTAGSTTGDVWVFTTESQPQAPNAPTNPSPIDDATGVSISNPTLSWTASPSATGYGVYFGTDIFPDDTEYQGSQAGLTFNPGTLSYATTYYWQIGALNAYGATSGTVWSFSTEAAPTAPTVTTQAVTNISQTAAVGNGTVTDDGGATVTERGVVAALVTLPTTSDLKFAAPGGGEGVFTASMLGLAAGTLYYVRSYAINSVGTSYGSEVQFTTDAASDPPAEGEVVAQITVANAVYSGVNGWYNYVRGTIPVASSVSSYNFYLRDIAGLAWPTDTIIAARGASSVANPSGIVETVELRAMVQFSSAGSHVLSVEQGSFASTGTYSDNIVLQLATTAPDSFANQAEVNFTSRILAAGTSTATAGEVTHTERKYGELTSANLNRLLGYSAYITTFAGIPNIWLIDMMMYNANVGSPDNPLGTSILPHIFFNELKMQFGAAGFEMTHLVPTPYTTTTQLMKPNDNGKPHVFFMGAMKPYRFVVHNSSNVTQANIILQHRGFFTCNHSKSLWSWSNPNTAFYGPAKYMTTDITLTNYPGFGVSPSDMFAGIGAGTAFTNSFPGPNDTQLTTPLGPYHIRGPTDGGYSGGIGIEGFKGYEIINTGDPNVLKTYMVVMEMDLDRSAGWKSNFGSPYNCGVALVDASQAPIVAGEWTLTAMEFTNNPGKNTSQSPWPRNSVSQWRYNIVNNAGLLPDYYSTLNNYGEYKDSHAIRPMSPVMSLCWAFNDPLAKEVLAHFSTWGRARMYEEGLSDLASNWYSAEGPQFKPGKGGGSGIAGRIGGWAILNHCASFFFLDPNRRNSYAPWFSRIKEHHQASQLPSGSWQAYTQFGLPACEPTPPSNPPCGWGTGDAPCQNLYTQWVVNGYDWQEDPDEAASQAIEISIHSHAIMAMYRCTNDSAFLDMLVSGCAGLYNFHWRKEGGVPLGGPHFVTPVRKRTNIDLPAHTDLSAASDCATDSTDNYQVPAYILAALTYDQNHEEAWRCMHAMTGTSFGEGPGLGDVAGLRTSLFNACNITGYNNYDTNKMSEGYGALLAFIDDYLLNQ